MAFHFKGAARTTPATGLLIAATKGKIATDPRAGSSLDSSLARMLVTLGPADWSELRLRLDNWWALSSATGEQANTQAMSGEAVLTSLSTGAFARFKFGGANIGSVAAGGFLVSDALAPSAFGLTSFPRISQWMLTVRRTLGTSADSLPWMSTNESLTWEGEYEYQYASASSSAAAVAAAYLDAAPALAQVTSATTKQQTTGIAPPNTGATGISVMGGVALLGRATGAVRAAILIGDSIADGTNDTQSPQPTRHGNGIFGRGIADANGVPLAGLVKCTKSGDRAQWFAGVNAMRRTHIPYANVAIVEYGINDIAGGRTFAQVYADLKTIWALAKAQGVKWVAQSTILPKTTSTDAFVTTANQTPAAGFEPGGVRDQLNAQIKADAAAKANGLDDVIDIAAAVQDVTLPSRWAAPGGVAQTADGTHPYPSACVAAAAVVRSKLAATPLFVGGV